MKQKIKNYFNDSIKRYYLYAFLQSAGFFGAVLVPFYTQWGHINLFQIQLLQSWFMFWQFVLDVPTGIIADHFGRKYTLSAGAFCFGLGCLIYGVTPHFTLFLLGEFVMAVAISLINGADDALVYDTLQQEGREDEVKHVNGRAQSAALWGILVSSPIGAFIAAKLGLNMPMILTAIPMVLAGCIALAIKEPQFHKEIQKQNPFILAKEGVQYFYRHKALRLLTLDSIIVGASAYFIVWLYQPALIQQHVPIFWFGLVTPVLVGSEILISHNFARIERLMGGAKRYLSLSALITGSTFILAGVFPNLFTIGLFIILAGGFGLTRMTLMSPYLNKHIPSEKRATILSAVSMTRRFSLVFLNPIVGFIADKSLSVAFIGLGILALSVFFFSPVEKTMVE